MKWLQKQVSLYTSHTDNTGRPATFRDILLCDFAEDLPVIIELRKLDRNHPQYVPWKRDVKALLQCYTPAGLLASKAKGKLTEIERSGMMQLDFDPEDIHEYDIEELKQAVFSLPFVGFCGLSCSGDGFYALVQIAEPDRLSEYAEHCFNVLKAYGIKPDTSKGKKVENLRYLSYDSNMLIREDPEPLHITHFRGIPAPKKKHLNNVTKTIVNGKEGLIRNLLNEIKNTQVGQRWINVQRVAFTLGGLGDPLLISALTTEIEANPAFNGEEEKYCKCADVCFEAGRLNPLK